MPREFSLVVFGATGFTGCRVALRVDELIRKNLDPLFADASFRWAIAGRSESALGKLRARLSSAPAVLVADVGNSASLASMAARTHLVLNCVGPYRLYGAPVVAACVAGKTHYLDVTGEPEFIVRSVNAFDDAARRDRLLIVHCAGFDSVPADMGAQHATEVLRAADVVPVFVESHLTVDNPLNAPIHYATYHSAVLGFGARDSLVSARKQLTASQTARGETPPTRHPKGRETSQSARVPAEGRRWTLPFLGSDAAVVRMSQHYLANRDAKKSMYPTYSAFFTVGSIFTVLMIAIFGVVLSRLAPFSWGRWLLLRYPRVFTGGWFSHAGPTEVQMAAASFRMRFYGRGEAKDGSLVQCVTEVAGREPGYVATPQILVDCARVLLSYVTGPRAAASSADAPAAETMAARAHDNAMPAEMTVGVLTPSAAFSHTPLRSVLHSSGLTFTVIAEPAPLRQK